MQMRTCSLGNVPRTPRVQSAARPRATGRASHPSCTRAYAPQQHQQADLVPQHVNLDTEPCSTSSYSIAHSIRSKRLLLSAAAASLAAAALLPARPAQAAADAPALDAPGASAGSGALDLTVTHTVSFTIGIADRALKKAEDRAIGDKSIIPEAEPTGKIVIGLYGNHAPGTVSNFLKLVESGQLVGTTFSRVLPGEYIMAGKQGPRRLGQLDPPKDIQGNPDTTSPAAFRLPHYRPGTLSLALSESDDDPNLQQAPGYVPLNFLITTGPGPVPRLDGANIVFGRVLDGMSTISAVGAVPTFGPSPVGNSSAFNALAKALGDERAATVRRKYGKPLKAVVVLGAELVPAADQVAAVAASREA